jgi:sterol desaturase/sphingolipid hydroxylase (fatty acid hydroxylase superfamily)
MSSNLSRTISFTIGTFMSINFAIFWAVPVMGMGLVWKHGFKRILMPIYDVFDKSRMVRSFAASYVYTNPQHADFFVTTLFIVLNCIFCLGTVFYWQLTTGQLPWWLIAAYLCSWVGFGGRVMGGAYTLAHKEV